MYIQGWHMPCAKEDMMPFMLRSWIGKDDLIQISFYLPLSENDVKIVTPASAYCQKNNEEPFGVLVESLGYFI